MGSKQFGMSSWLWRLCRLHAWSINGSNNSTDIAER
jgi:hypothetical protein